MKKDLRANLGVSKKPEEELYRDVDKERIEDVKKVYSQYAGKDEGELKQKLFEMAKQGKEDGSLNDESIDNMAKKIAPMLDKEKQQKLNSLLSMLKNNQY